MRKKLFNVRGMTWNLRLENLAGGDPGVCGTMAAYSMPGFSWSRNCLQSGSLQLPGCAEPWLIILLQPGQQSSMEAGQSSRGRFSSFLFVRCQMKLQQCLLKASSVPLGRDTEFPTSHRLDTSHGHTALASTVGQLQHFMSQLLKNSRGWKHSKQHRGFMTSPPGLSWHPVLAAVSYLASTASVSYPELFPTSVWGTYSTSISTRTNSLLEGRGVRIATLVSPTPKLSHRSNVQFCKPRPFNLLGKQMCVYYPKFGDIHDRYWSTCFALRVQRILSSALQAMGKPSKATQLLGASALDQRGQANPIW